jgi:hypothetical protein
VTLAEPVGTQGSTWMFIVIEVAVAESTWPSKPASENVRLAVLVSKLAGSSEPVSVTEFPVARTPWRIVTVCEGKDAAWADAAWQLYRPHQASAE